MRWDETDASGRTGRTAEAGHRTAGRWTGGHQTAGRPDPWTTNPGDRTLDGWTPDGLDSRILTTNRMGGHRMVDADRRPTPWLESWHCRPRRRRPTAGCRMEAPPSRRRLGEQQTRTAHSKDHWDGPGHAATVSWRLGALLSLAWILVQR